MNRYIEYIKEYNKVIDNLPIAFAFSESQLEEVLVKLNATREELIMLSSGAICKKENVKSIKDTFKFYDGLLLERLKEENFFKDAVSYQLNNTEYGYTGDDTDALESLGLTQELIKSYGFWELYLELLKGCE